VKGGYLLRPSEYVQARSLVRAIPPSTHVSLSPGRTAVEAVAEVRPQEGPASFDAESPRAVDVAGMHVYNPEVCPHSSCS
jgi:hypothetical protein